MQFTLPTMTVQIDGRGYVAALTVCGQNLLKSRQPLVNLGMPLAHDGCRAVEYFLPTSAEERDDGTLRLTMQNGSAVTLALRASDLCLSIEAVEVPDGAHSLVFGPIPVTLDEVVGDVIGVAQGGEVAVGMLAGCRKTLEGIPDEALNMLPEFTIRCLWKEDLPPEIGRVQDLTMRAASWLEGGGASLQFWAKDRTREETGRAAGAENMLIEPLPAGDPDAVIAGAKVLLFGCPRKEALAWIGKIEEAEGLPHPLMENGEWVKTARRAMKSYLISGFSRDEVDLVLDKAALAGMDTIYHEDPFRNWGHFAWRPDLAADDEDFRKNVSAKAAARGMKIGLHTLTNFTTTNDPYVSPVPCSHLVKMARLRLLAPLDEERTDALVEAHSCFSVVQTLNAVQAGEEIFTFAAEEPAGDGIRLTGLTRGAFGTAKKAHAAGEIVTPLRDHGYRVFFPDIPLQDVYARRIAELFNATGAAQISYDGLEGCCYTGQDNYAPTRFVTDCGRLFDHFVLNDASRLTHFNWHVHSRMNWGEPWGEAMRTGQVETRIRNQAYFRRNLFPRMLGWFLLRTAERKFEASTREDLEWAMSEAAGFDAGYGMTIRPPVMRGLGNIDTLLGLMKDWDRLRLSDSFTEEQKARLRDPANEFRLEKQDENRYLLFPIALTQPYLCALSEMQPGQPGGADWTVENRQGPSFAFRLRVDGDGAIRDPMFATAGGTIRFPCEVGDGQYLLFDFDGTAAVTDRNYNVLAKVTPVGQASLPKGHSAVSFTCAHGRDETPDVTVRFLTRGAGEEIAAKE